MPESHTTPALSGLCSIFSYFLFLDYLQGDTPELIKAICLWIGLQKANYKLRKVSFRPFVIKGYGGAKLGKYE